MKNDECCHKKDLENLSEKELLLHFGFKPHQIIDLPDGGAMLNYEMLRHDLLKRNQDDFKNWIDRDEDQ